MRSPSARPPRRGSEPPYDRHPSRATSPKVAPAPFTWLRAAASDTQIELHTPADVANSRHPNDIADNASATSSALDLLDGTPAPTLPDVTDEDEIGGTPGDVDMADAEPAPSQYLPPVAATVEQRDQPLLPTSRHRSPTRTATASPPRLTPAQKGKGRAEPLFLRSSHSASPTRRATPVRRTVSRTSSGPAQPPVVYTIDDDTDEDDVRPAPPARSPGVKAKAKAQAQAQVKRERAAGDSDDDILPLSPQPRAPIDTVEISSDEDDDDDGAERERESQGEGETWSLRYHTDRAKDAVRVLTPRVCRDIINFRQQPSALHILRGSSISEGRVNDWGDVCTRLGVPRDRQESVKEYDYFIRKHLQKTHSLKGVFADLEEMEE